MGQILHPRATTTERIRKEIQDSEKGISYLARLYHLDRKTVRKWKERGATAQVADLPCGGLRRQRCALTVEEEEIILAFRKKFSLALDDCLVALKGCIPRLTRSNLHRCLVRAGVSRLPAKEEDAAGPARGKGVFAPCELGYVHLDITDVQTGDGSKLFLFTAIERVSKYVHAALYTRKTLDNTRLFLKEVTVQFPFRIHTILTDNGSQFTYRGLPEALRPAGKHPFDQDCATLGIEHRLTEFYHPWTNGQNERFNRTLKEETVKKFHYANKTELSAHLKLFLRAYNQARRLRAIKHLTPHEKLLELYEKDAKLFNRKPVRFSLGPNS